MSSYFLIPLEILYSKSSEWVNLSFSRPRQELRQKKTKQKTEEIALTGYRTYSRSNSAFSDEEYKIMKNLNEDDFIIIIISLL